MSINIKKVLSFGLATVLSLNLAACGASETPKTSEKASDSVSEVVSESVSEVASEESEKPKEPPTVITFGTHWSAGDDPFYLDPITNEPVMSPDAVLAGKEAWQKVLDEINVEIKWITYSGDVREVLLQSVLANDPVCEIVRMWGGSQGTILGQNVLQDLEPHKDIFAAEEDAWMFLEPIFGHNYFINSGKSHVGTWPLVFNINYIEKVDSLKENGETVYPTDLYKNGQWTWSKFEEYLTKIDAFYKNTPSPTRPDVKIKAFETDYRYTLQQAWHANGVASFGKNGLQIDTPEAIAGAEYIDNLMSKNLLMSVRYGDDSPTPGWTWNGDDFGKGETVFTNMVPWISAGASEALAGRGESMGVVPFPRPDALAADDPKYQQESKMGDTSGVLRGVSEEKTVLALEAFKLYNKYFMNELNNISSPLEFIDKTGETQAIAFGFDIFHEKIGADILENFKNMSPAEINEFNGVLGIEYEINEEIAGKSFYGLEGSPKYAVAVKEKLSKVTNKLAASEAAISSGKVTDNIAPSLKELKPMVFAKGTTFDPAVMVDYVEIVDNIDGALDVATATIDATAVDFNTIAKYDGGIVVTIKDSSGNILESKLNTTVYDPDNKTAPVIVAKAEYRKIVVDEDASLINWGGDFIETATDANEFDIKANIVADITELDVSTPGEYNVVITVLDYAGNEAKTTLKVIVE